MSVDRICHTACGPATRGSGRGHTANRRYLALKKMCTAVEDQFASLLGPGRGELRCPCGAPLILDEPDSCSVVNDGCLAPAGWRSDGAGIPSRAQLGFHHDGTRAACLRCGEACCQSCLTETVCALHGTATISLCPSCLREERRS